MDWGARGTPAPPLKDFGLDLRELVVETPDPDAVHAALDAIGMIAQADHPARRCRAAVGHNRNAARRAYAHVTRCP